MGKVYGYDALLASGAVLQWVEGEKFQLSAQGLSLPCFGLGDGTIGEYVFAQRNSSAVTGFTIPGLIPGAFIKKIS